MRIILDENQLNYIIDSVNGEGFDWSPIIPIVTLILGYMLNHIQSHRMSKKMQKKELYNSQWEVFVYIQYLNLEIEALRKKLEYNLHIGADNSRSLNLNEQIDRFKINLWDLFFMFDSKISKEERDKKEFSKLNNDVLNIHQKLRDFGITAYETSDTKTLKEKSIELECCIDDFIIEHVESVKNKKLNNSE